MHVGLEPRLWSHVAVSLLASALVVSQEFPKMEPIPEAVFILCARPWQPLKIPPFLSSPDFKRPLHGRAEALVIFLAYSSLIMA